MTITVVQMSPTWCGAMSLITMEFQMIINGILKRGLVNGVGEIMNFNFIQTEPKI